MPSGTTDTQDVFNVLDYGADSTGVSDCTTAITKALAAAASNVASTSRRSTVFFPGGKYHITGRLDRIPQFELKGLSRITIAGGLGDRARLYMDGDSKNGNWTMFWVDGESSDILFSNLTLEQGTLSNPDPDEQNHILQIGSGVANGATDIRVRDCEFVNSKGDGIRLLGEFGGAVERVQVQRCRFLNCGRSSISFQRWVRNCVIEGCYFYGGTDQQIDFEPTGFALTADSAGCTATTLRYSAGHVTTYGLKPGDEVYNATEKKIVQIVSIDSDTQITTTGGVTDWTSDQFYFPLHCANHLIVGNQFVSGLGLNAQGILVSLEEAFHVRFVDNEVQGTLYGLNMRSCTIANNRFEWREGDPTGYAALRIIEATDELLVANNDITVRAETGRLCAGIDIAYQNGYAPVSAVVTGNNIRMQYPGTGITITDIDRCLIANNIITVDTYGDSRSVGINVEAIDNPVSDVSIVDNIIAANTGTYAIGIQVGGSASITSVTVGGGYIRNCLKDILFPSSGNGQFLNPPVLIAGAFEDTGIVPPSSTKWIQLAGVGGSAPTTNSLKPAVYWGSGNPNGVLSAGVGCLALCYDGGPGKALYVKESGTGNTGWTSK